MSGCRPPFASPDAAETRVVPWHYERKPLSAQVRYVDIPFGNYARTKALRAVVQAFKETADRLPLPVFSGSVFSSGLLTIHTACGVRWASSHIPSAY